MILSIVEEEEVGEDEYKNISNKYQYSKNKL